MTKAVAPKLADLQAQFQNSVLEGGDAILDAISNGAQEEKSTLFDVYRDAYRLRLIGILRHDYARLATFMGQDDFDALARAFIAAHPSHTTNARWYGVALPDFISSYAPYQAQPELYALARLEALLNDAFDEADTPPLAMEDLSRFLPEQFASLSFTPHPSVHRMNADFDLNALWSALDPPTDPASQQSAPSLELLPGAQALLIWRQDLTSRFRVLDPQEAMMWDEAAKGVSFGVLCEMLAMYDEPESAPLRAATHLQAWIAGGLLAHVTLT